MQIQVSRVDLDGRKIDFRMVNDLDDLALRSVRDKGPAKVAGKSVGKASGIHQRADGGDVSRDKVPASKRRQGKGRGTPSGTPAKAPASKALYKKKMGKVRTSKR